MARALCQALVRESIYNVTHDRHRFQKCYNLVGHTTEAATMDSCELLDYWTSCARPYSPWTANMIFRSQDCGAIAILVSVLGHIVVQGQIQSSNLPYVTHTGYLNVNKDDGSRIFYSYYESQQTLTVSTAPILLWLQACHTPFRLSLLANELINLQDYGTSSVEPVRVIWTKTSPLMLD